MADQNTQAALQYFDYQLITKQSPGINDRYTDIVNYTPVKNSYYNDSYKTKFTQGIKELPDSAYISLIKRWGFNRIRLRDWNSGETNLVEDPNPNKWMFTDCVFLDGLRYMFAVYYDYSRMRIYKQMTVTDNEGCGNDNYEDVTTGEFVNITKYNGQYYFPFSKCLYDKFVTTQFGKGLSKDSGTNGIVRNELMGDYLSIQTLFYDSVTGAIGGGPGDYLCLYDGSLATQMNYIAANGISSIHTPIVNNCLQMSSPFFGMYKVKVGQKTTTLVTSTITDAVENTSDAMTEESTAQKWKVFSDYGDVLSFVTADGIFILNYAHTKPSETEFTYEGCSYFDTNFLANPAKYVISCLIKHDDAMYYYDIKSGRIFGGLQGVSKFFFDTRNAYCFGKDYTHMVSISGVMLLVGESRLSLIKPKQVGEGIVTFTGFMPLSEKIGYFDRDSFCMEDGVFYIINSEGSPVGRTFTSYYDIVTPNPKDIPIGYASDMTVLRKGREYVCLSVLAGDIYISISHQEMIQPDPDLPNYNIELKGNTKVILFSGHCQLWYKWMLSGIVLRGFKNGVRFGNNIYSYQGNTDYNSYLNEDRYFKTILKAQVGQDNLDYTKTIAYTRTLLGYNSYITKDNTIVKHNIDLGGWHWELKYGDLRRDDYVTNLMKLRGVNNLATTFKNYPIGIEMIGGNGIGLSPQEDRYLENEFSAWDIYAPANDSDSNEKVDFRVSKMATFQINLNIPVDYMTVEYITYNDNALEIGGILFGYTIDSINQVRFSNNSTQQDPYDSGPTGEPLTPDSGNESKVA